MFRVKVCGVTRAEDLQVLAAAGVDAVGINVIPTSPRCVAPELARQLCQQARQLGLMSVLVTMNYQAEELVRAVDQVRPDALQLHGCEQPSQLPLELRQLPIIKALSWSGRPDEMHLAQLWLEAGLARWAFLVDAYAPGVGGGSGKTARWDLLWPRPPLLDRVPMLLAGGLTPENVIQAIRQTRCSGVDTASGVESRPGIKDPLKVQAFATACSALPEGSTG